MTAISDGTTWIIENDTHGLTDEENAIMESGIIPCDGDDGDEDIIVLGENILW